jgi:protein-tyrosine-phosphatase
MTSILVLCTGNVCRSPIAEGMLRDALQRRFGSQGVSVASAGTAGWEGSGAMPESVQAAAERGVDIGGHVAQRLTPGMLQRSDLVLCMAGEHRDHVGAVFPEAAARAFTLKELARLTEEEPPDHPQGPDVLVERVRAADAARRAGSGGNPHDEDVVDPLGMSLESYRAIAWELEVWIERLVRGVFGPSEAPAPAIAEEA